MINNGGHLLFLYTFKIKKDLDKQDIINLFQDQILKHLDGIVLLYSVYQTTINKDISTRTNNPKTTIGDR